MSDNPYHLEATKDVLWKMKRTSDLDLDYSSWLMMKCGIDPRSHYVYKPTASELFFNLLSFDQNPSYDDSTPHTTGNLSEGQADRGLYCVQLISAQR